MISVCMTTFNGKKYLKEQLDSILSQLGEYDELLISDDGSTDGTKELIEVYQNQDRRIQLVSGPRQGVIKNVESVLALAKGEYIFFSDQDDIWLPNRVNQMCQIFANHPTIQVVLADLTIIDQKGEVIHPSYFNFRRVRIGRWQTVMRSGFIGAGMAIRHDFKQQVLPFPKDIPMHDMWIGALANQQVFLLHESLTLYRRHEENVSEIITTSSRMQQMIWRMNLIKGLILRQILKK